MTNTNLTEARKAELYATMNRTNQILIDRCYLEDGQRVNLTPETARRFTAERSAAEAEYYGW